MYTYGFEKLEVWQDARKLAQYIYLVTGRFPAEERFGITVQIRRAAVSIASNIAEGSGRQTKADLSHFYSMAYSSSLELLNELIISNDLNFLSNQDLSACRALLEKVTNKLNALKNALKKS